MNDVGILFIIAVALVSGLLLGFKGCKSPYENMLDSCAKQHNVYECKLVAVPKEGK